MTETSTKPHELLGSLERFSCAEDISQIRGEGTFLVNDSHHENERVVVKVIPMETLSDPKGFKREFESLSRLSHPKLGRYIDCFPLGDNYIVCSEYIQGRNLTSYLSSPPTPGELSKLRCDSGHDSHESDDITGTDDSEIDLLLFRLELLLPQLVDALEHLHRFRKCHGKLTSENVIVDDDGHCFLIDYGIESLLQRQDSAPHNADCDEMHTKSSAPVNIDGDLFSLGVLLFEAIAQEKYELSDCNSGSGEAYSFNVPAQSLAELEPRCPATWLEIVHGLLETNPESRLGLSEIHQLHAQSERRAVHIPPSTFGQRPLYFERHALLESLLTRAKQHVYQKEFLLTLLEGNTGVGKSVFLDALSAWAAEHGWFVLRGRCYKRESMIYQGWDQIIEQFADICHQFPAEVIARHREDLSQAGQLFPVLRDALAHAELYDSSHNEPPPVSRGLRQRCIASLRRLMAIASEQRPILICLDDIHWAGWDTAELLIDLFAQPLEIRCIFIVALDNESESLASHPLTRFLHLLPNNTESVAIEQFSNTEAHAYVAAAGAHLPEERQHNVLKDANKHPLVLNELLHHEDQHSLNQNGSGSSVRKSSSDRTGVAVEAKQQHETSPVGESFHRLVDVLQQRIHQLSRAERLALQLLAVSSCPLSQESISKIITSELGVNQLHGATGQTILGRLVDLRLVQRIQFPGVGPTTRSAQYTVKHHYYREYIQHDLGHDHHCHLCHLIAQSIDGTDLESEVLRFEYLLRAEQYRAAAKSAWRAAPYIESRFAFNRAAKLWRWLLYQSNTIDDQATERQCKANLAHAESLAGRYQSAATLYQELAVNHSSRDERARHHYLEAHAWLQCGDISRAREAFSSALNTKRLSPKLTNQLPGLWNIRRKLAIRKLCAAEPEKFASKSRAITSSQHDRACLYWSLLETQHLFNSQSGPYYHGRLTRLSARAMHPYWAGLSLLSAPIEYTYAIFRTSPRDFNKLYQCAKQFLDQSHSGGRFLYDIARTKVYIGARQFDKASELLDQISQNRYAVVDSFPFYEHAYLHLRASFYAEQAELSSARKYALRILHFCRGNRLAETDAYLLLTRVALLQGLLLDAESSLHQLSQNIRLQEDSMLRVYFACAQSQLNIAQGQCDVAVAQFDILLERMHSNGLFNVPAALFLTQLRLGQALAALADRELHLQEPRANETLSRLRKTLSKLRRVDGKLSGDALSELERLQARYFLLQKRPKKALRAAERAIRCLDASPNLIVQAKCAEIRGIILQTLDRPEGKHSIEQAHRLYQHVDCYLPLILEGWPVPKSRSLLREDAPNAS